MYCSKCGGVMADGAAFCPNCGQAFAVAALPPRAPMMSASASTPLGGGGMAIPAYAGYAAAPRVEYAGFWVRFLAWLIDNVVMGVGVVLILIPLIFLTGLRTVLDDFHPNEDMNDAGVFMLIGFVFVLATASLVVTWLYHALMESSEWQFGVAGYSREEGVRPRSDGYGWAARQFRARHGKALCQNHHEPGVLRYRTRILVGCLHGKEAGAPRYAGGVPGAATKRLTLVDLPRCR